MTDNRDGTKRYTPPEVLPPLPQSVSLTPEVANLPQGLLGMSLFARARYASEQKQFEAYTRLVNAKNALVRALTEQRLVTIQYVEASEEVRNLDDVRERARLRMRAEMATLRQTADLAELRFETEKARLEYERDQYRTMRTKLNAPPPSPPSREEQSTADKFKAVGKEIEEIMRAYDEMRAEVVGDAGGEQNLPDAKRRALSQAELLRDNLVNAVMAELG